MIDLEDLDATIGARFFLDTTRHGVKMNALEDKTWDHVTDQEWSWSVITLREFVYRASPYISKHAQVLDVIHIHKHSRENPPVLTILVTPDMINPHKETTND